MVGSGQQMHGTSPSTPTTAGGKVMQFVQSSNMLDLLGLVVLLVVAVATDGGKPRQAFVVKQFLNDNNSYPYHKDTVPSWTVPVRPHARPGGGATPRHANGPWPAPGAVAGCMRTGWDLPAMAGNATHPPSEPAWPRPIIASPPRCPRRLTCTCACMYAQVFSILGPLLCFAAYKWLAKRSHYEVYRLSVNFLFACLLTGAITNSLKLGVGRLRPNFAVRCWPSGNQTFLPAAPNLDVGIIGGAVCDASVPQSIQNEIRKSWPSGHSSWSAAGLGYFSLFLLGQLHVWAGAGWGWRVVLSLAPTFGAIAVGVTRIIDYW